MLTLKTFFLAFQGLCVLLYITIYFSFTSNDSSAYELNSFLDPKGRGLANISAHGEVTGKAPAKKRVIVKKITKPKPKPILIKVDPKNPFRTFGAYAELTPSHFNMFEGMKPAYDKITYGLKHEDDYCDRVDLYNLENPESMFTRKSFFTDYRYDNLARKMIIKEGKVPMPKIERRKLDKFKNPEFPFDTKINNFYTMLEEFYQYHKIGTHFLCATQMFNHIPGNGALVRKDLILGRIQAYKKKFAKQPQCLDKDSFFLPFYRLNYNQECRRFFNLINSKKYKQSLSGSAIQYVVKIGYGAHKSQGVFILDAKKTNELNRKYNFGWKCGKRNDSLIVQKYIENPLLLDLGNKFDFRIYMLIASTNPLILYYHDGYLRVSLNTFNLNSKDKATHLTNTAVAAPLIEEAKKKKKTINGMTPNELAEYHLWYMEDLQKYLLEIGKISDPNWLDNYLRPQFQKAFIHLIKMSSDAFWKQSNVYELHGLDFMLDNNLKLWFIESNPNPLLEGVKPDLISKMLVDAFEIQYAYYRSRMSRVLDVINKMKMEKSTGKVDYVKWKEAYDVAVKNKIEPKYEISEGNTFTLILDESRPKKEAYFNHIPSECF